MDKEKKLVVDSIVDDIKDEKLKEIKDKLKEAMDENLVESLLSSNEIEFEYLGIDYKVRKLLYKERQELYRERAKEHMRLLQSDEYVPEDKIIELYKNKGTDIKELGNQIKVLQKQIDNLNMKLGKALKDKANDKELTTYKNQISDLTDKQKDISIKKTNYLTYSLENQVNLYSYSYLTYLSSEKLEKGKDLGEGNKEQDKWVKVWNNYDEFLNSEEELINLLAFRVTILTNPSLYSI